MWKKENNVIDLEKHLVNRFLSWKLPDDFTPDAGISFVPDFNIQTRHPMRHEPTGTNLFNEPQATEMVRYMLEDAPTKELRPTEELVFKENEGIIFNGPTKHQFSLTNGRVAKLEKQVKELLAQGAK